MGVWIETFYLKYLTSLFSVTPYVGVWIETSEIALSSVRSSVTPYVGVWIETLIPGYVE